MAASYADSYTLAQDIPFQQRLRICALLVINANLNNPSEEIKNWNKRAIHDWAANVTVVAEAMAATPSITSSSTDAELNTRMTQLWPTLAGITV